MIDAAVTKDALVALRLGDVLELPGPFIGLGADPMLWRLVSRLGNSKFTFEVTCFGVGAGEVSLYPSSTTGRIESFSR